MIGSTLETMGYWQTGGLLLLPIALVCFGIWLYFLRTRLHLSDVLKTSPGFEHQVTSDLAGKPVPDVIRAYEERPGVLPGAVVCALEAARHDDNPNEAFDMYQQAMTGYMEKDMVVLRALTGAAPLLGLMGTVVGMIATFDAVSSASGETANRVASGIGQALITTQFGLVVAIPGVFGIARLQRMLDQVNIRFASCKSHLLMALTHPPPGGRTEHGEAADASS